MFRWLVSELFWLVIGVVFVIALVIAFFAFGGPEFVKGVIDAVVRETGGVID